jgi:hypothetical protein
VPPIIGAARAAPSGPAVTNSHGARGTSEATAQSTASAIRRPSSVSAERRRPRPSHGHRGDERRTVIGGDGGDGGDGGAAAGGALQGGKRTIARPLFGALVRRTRTR